MEKKQPRKSRLPMLRSLYWSWILCLGLFLLALFSIRLSSILDINSWMVILLLFSLVMAGTMIYLILMIKIIRNLRTQDGRWYGLATLLVFFAFFSLLFNYTKIEAKLGFTIPTTVRPVTNPPVPSNQVKVTPPKATPTIVPKQPTNNNAKVNTIECTGPDGKTFQTTQEECTAFNAAWGNAPKPETTNNGQQVNIPCHLSHGTYNLTPEQCAQAQQSNSGSNNYTYTVPPLPNTSLGNDYTSSGNSYTTSSNNAELQQACISDAMRAAEQELQKKLSILSAQGFNGSAVERAEKDALARVERETRQCMLRYPTN